MTNQDPKRFQSQRIPILTLVAIVIYFGVGYQLMNKFWPDSDTGLWVLIVVGMVGGYIFQTAPTTKRSRLMTRKRYV